MKLEVHEAKSGKWYVHVAESRGLLYLRRDRTIRQAVYDSAADQEVGFWPTQEEAQAAADSFTADFIRDARDAARVDDHDTLRRQVETLRGLLDRAVGRLRCDEVIGAILCGEYGE